MVTAMQVTRTSFFGLFRAFSISRAPPRTLAVVVGRKSSRVFFVSSVNDHSKVVYIYTHIKQIGGYPFSVLFIYGIFFLFICKYCVNFSYDYWERKICNKFMFDKVFFLIKVFMKRV